MQKIALLRVGADSGNLGFHSPLFKDGSYDYIPINETYNDKPKNKDKKIIETRRYGNAKLASALEEFKKHIIYFEDIEGTTMPKLWRVYNKHLALVSFENDTDEEEQSQIIRQIKQQNKSKKELLNELNNIPENEPAKVEFCGKSYKRENYNIAKIKLLRGSKCQICSTAIIKRDGTEYIEAAHITPKHEKGRETLDNIILLCPNHHKEFDLGNRIEISRTKLEIQFFLNGTKYNVKFEPE